MRWRSDLRLLVLKLDRADLERRLRSLVGDPPTVPLTFDVAAPLAGPGSPLAGTLALVRHATRREAPARPGCRRCSAPS